MKLYKKLLPIASLTSVVAIVTPFVTSCGTKVIELDEEIYWPDDAYGLKSKKSINIKTKKQYEVNIDTSKIVIPTLAAGDGSWMFFATPEKLSTNLTTVKPIEIKIWVDDTELEQKDNPDDPNCFQVCQLTPNENSWAIVGTCDAFKEKSKIKVMTSFEENEDDCFIYFFELWHVL